jgi:multidrug efflux pump subunit AcrB
MGDVVVKTLSMQFAITLVRCDFDLCPSGLFDSDTDDVFKNPKVGPSRAALTGIWVIHQVEEPSRWSQQLGAWIENIIVVYGKALNWVLERPGKTWAVFLGTLALTGLLYAISDKGFFPEQDTGSIQVITEASQSSSFLAMKEKQQEVAAAFLFDPDVLSLTSFIGVDGQNMSINNGRMMLELKPKREMTHNVNSSVVLEERCVHQRHACLFPTGPRPHLGRPCGQSPLTGVPLCTQCPHVDALREWSEKW